MSRAQRLTRRTRALSWVLPARERVVKPARPLCFVAAQGIAFPALLALILLAVGIAVEVSRSPEAAQVLSALRMLFSAIGGLK